MKEFHAYRNDNGTYRLKVITLGGDKRTYIINYPSVYFSTNGLTLRGDGGEFLSFVVEDDDYEQECYK